VIEDEESGPGGTAQPGRFILTIYGLYARQHSGWLPIAAVVRLMGEVGINVQAVRSAIHRLKRRALLIAERRNGAAGYTLSAGARRLLAEGDVRIFGHSRALVEDGWLLVVFSVPDTERAKRYQLRSTLTRLGFGTVSPGTWVAPRHLETAVRETLDRLGLSGFTQMFSGAHIAGGDLTELVRSWWDLDGLQTLYAEFLERFGPIGNWWAEEPGSDVRAFVDYVEMLTTWRRLPYADPGLPLALLPSDWNGLRAEQLFADLSNRLAEPANRFVDPVLASR
jgi:phenylacetic acid degradation operon negative regulatory protein